MTKDSKADLVTPEDVDLIAFWTQRYHLGAIAHLMIERGFPRWKFDPPVLYPRAKMYVGLRTAGFTNVCSGFVKIGYTLEKVSKEDFIAALVE